MGEKEEKKRRKSSPICFRNFSVNYKRRGVNLSRWGANRNFEIFESGPFQNIFEVGLLMEEATNSHGRARRQPPPRFPINRRREAVSKYP